MMMAQKRILHNLEWHKKVEYYIISNNIDIISAHGIMQHQTQENYRPGDAQRPPCNAPDPPSVFLVSSLLLPVSMKQQIVERANCRTSEKSC